MPDTQFAALPVLSVDSPVEAVPYRGCFMRHLEGEPPVEPKTRYSSLSHLLPAMYNKVVLSASVVLFA